MPSASRCSASADGSGWLARNSTSSSPGAADLAGCGDAPQSTQTSANLGSLSNNEMDKRLKALEAAKERDEHEARERATLEALGVFAVAGRRGGFAEHRLGVDQGALDVVDRRAVEIGLRVEARGGAEVAGCRFGRNPFVYRLK